MSTESEILGNRFFKIREKQGTQDYFRIILNKNNTLVVVKMNETKERFFNPRKFLNDKKFSSELEAIEYMNKLKFFAEEMKTNNMKSAIHFFVNGIERVIADMERNPNMSKEEILRDLKKMVKGIKA